MPQFRREPTLDCCLKNLEYWILHMPYHEEHMARSTQSELHDIGSEIALADCPELVEVHLLDNLGLAESR